MSELAYQPPPDTSAANIAPAVAGADGVSFVLAPSEADFSDTAKELIEMGGFTRVRQYNMKGMGSQTASQDISRFLSLGQIPHFSGQLNGLSLEDLRDQEVPFDAAMEIDMLRAFGHQAPNIAPALIENLEQARAAYAAGDMSALDTIESIMNLVTQAAAVKKLEGFVQQAKVEIPNFDDIIADLQSDSPALEGFAGEHIELASALTALIADVAQNVAALTTQLMQKSAIAPSIVEAIQTRLIATAEVTGLQKEVAPAIQQIERQAEPAQALQNDISALTVTLEAMLARDDLSDDAREQIEAVLEALENHPEGQPLSLPQIAMITELAQSLSGAEGIASMLNITDQNGMTDIELPAEIVQLLETLQTQIQNTLTSSTALKAEILGLPPAIVAQMDAMALSVDTLQTSLQEILAQEGLSDDAREQIQAVLESLQDHPAGQPLTAEQVAILSEITASHNDISALITASGVAALVQSSLSQSAALQSVMPNIPELSLAQYEAITTAPMDVKAQIETITQNNAVLETLSPVEQAALVEASDTLSAALDVLETAEPGSPEAQQASAEVQAILEDLPTPVIAALAPIIANQAEAPVVVVNSETATAPTADAPSEGTEASPASQTPETTSEAPTETTSETTLETSGITDINAASPTIDPSESSGAEPPSTTAFEAPEAPAPATETVTQAADTPIQEGQSTEAPVQDTASQDAPSQEASDQESPSQDPDVCPGGSNCTCGKHFNDAAANDPEAVIATLNAELPSTMSADIEGGITVQQVNADGSIEERHYSAEEIKADEAIQQDVQERLEEQGYFDASANDAQDQALEAALTAPAEPVSTDINLTDEFHKCGPDCFHNQTLETIAADAQETESSGPGTDAYDNVSASDIDFAPPPNTNDAYAPKTNDPSATGGYDEIDATKDYGDQIKCQGKCKDCKLCFAAAVEGIEQIQTDTDDLIASLKTEAANTSTAPAAAEQEKSSSQKPAAKAKAKNKVLR